MEDQKQQTKPKVPPIVDEQLSDILLVMNEKEYSLEAVKSIDENGKVETVPAKKEHENEFMRVGHNSDIFDVVMTGLKNFISQAKDPTGYSIYRVPRNILKNSWEVLKDLAKDKSQRSQSADAFADKYQVETSSQKSAQINNSTNQKESKMAKQENKEPQVVQETAERQPRFNESMVNWKELEKFGISKQFLKDKGELPNLLNGYKSRGLIPITLNTGSTKLRAEARLSLGQDAQGQVFMNFHGVLQQPKLDRPFFGHNFSPEDKKNLTEGNNMGRAVNLLDRNKELHPYIISKDPLTNELVAARADRIYIPETIGGIKVDKDDEQRLRNGERLTYENMTSKSGKEYTADIQLSALTRNIEYIFPNQEVLGMKIGGKELTEEQFKDYTQGKPIYMEDMKRTDGGLWTAYVTKDTASGRPNYTLYNPDSPEGAREIVIPKEINGVELEKGEREVLSRGNHIFLDGMIDRKGKEFSGYVRLNMETGQREIASKPEDFGKVAQAPQIPDELYKAKLTPKQKGELQDGKSVFVKNMQGYDGEKFNAYAKVINGSIRTFPNDPDKNKNSQQNSQKTSTAEKVQEKTVKKSRGPKV